MESQVEFDSYEKYLESEIVMYCLKKCINGPHLSPALKVKVLFLIYGDNECYEESTLRSVSTISSRTTIKPEFTKSEYDYKDDLNFLGVDDDLLLESPEMLTSEEQAQLKDCILEEIDLFHKFCTSLDVKVKVPYVEGSLNDMLQDLDDQILQQTSCIENLLSLLHNVHETKLETMSSVDKMIETAVSDLQSLKSTGSILFEEIVKEMTDGDQRHYLERAERILEEKIARDKEKIEELKFELRFEC